MIREETIIEIIQGLEFTVDMFLFDPATGEEFSEPRNKMDKITIDACNGAIELLRKELVRLADERSDSND